MNVSDILARRKPAVRKVRLLLDGTLAQQVEDLRREILQTRAREAVNPQGLATRIPELEQRLRDLESDAEEATATFVFQAIGRSQLEEIKRRHPPTEEQWEAYREESRGNVFTSAPSFDWVGLAPDLIAASCIDPSMSLGDAKTLWDTLSDGEAAELFSAAWGVNEQTSTRPTSGTDTDSTPSFGPDSTMPLNMESLSLSLRGES